MRGSRGSLYKGRFSVVALIHGSEWCEAEVQNLFKVYRDTVKSTWFPSELYTIYQLSHNCGLQEGQENLHMVDI